MLDCDDLSASCIADIEATFNAAAAEEEAAKADLEAARIAAEEAAANTAAEPLTEIPVEWQGVVSALVNMGFAESMAEQVTITAQGEFDAALEAALNYVPPPPPQPPAAALVKSSDSIVSDVSDEMPWDNDWDCLLEELVEMGFEDAETNKRLVSANSGDLKSTVTALVTEERAGRQV